MAGSLFGLGSGTPSRFPYPDRPQPSPGIGPGQSAVTRARVVIVSGPTGAVNGVFVYSPGTTPALGNPPVAWITASSSDPFGNTLPSATGIIIGTGNPTSGPVVGLGQGQLTGYAAGELAGGIQFPGSRAMRLVTPTQSVSDTAGILSMFAESFTGLLPRLAFNGQVIFTSGTPAAPTEITTDSPNTATLLNGWAGGPLRYWLNPDNTISVVGPVNPAAMTSTTIAQLPPSYVPSVGGDWPVAAHTATPPTQGLFTRVTNTGAVVALNATAGSGIFGVAITGCPLN